MSDRILDHDLEHTWRSLGSHERSRLDGASILVIGCGGFLGFYALQFLMGFREALGIRSILGIDNCMLRRPPWFEIAPRCGVVHLTEFDIVKNSLADLPGAAEADLVLHMASIGSSPFFRRYSIETADANVWGLRNVLEFYRDRDVRGLLFFSSSEIYGDPLPQFIPTPETNRGNVPCIGPRACYDESKRFGETLCYLFAERFDMPVTVVRPFNTYGPGMVVGDRRVPADFAEAVIENRDIEILSDGSPTRTFCYVADALAGYVKVLCHGTFDVFNIGMDRPEITMRELAELYREEGRAVFAYEGAVRLGRPTDPFYLSDSPSRRCPDISKARRVLGFAPKIEVREGINRYLRFLKEEGAA